MSLEEIWARVDTAASKKNAQSAIVANIWAQLFHSEELPAVKGGLRDFKQALGQLCKKLADSVGSYLIHLPLIKCEQKSLFDRDLSELLVLKPMEVSQDFMIISHHAVQ